MCPQINNEYAETKNAIKNYLNASTAFSVFYHLSVAAEDTFSLASIYLASHFMANDYGFAENTSHMIAAGTSLFSAYAHYDLRRSGVREKTYASYVDYYSHMGATVTLFSRQAKNRITQAFNNAFSGEEKQAPVRRLGGTRSE